MMKRRVQYMIACCLLAGLNFVSGCGGTEEVKSPEKISSEAERITAEEISAEAERTTVEETSIEGERKAEEKARAVEGKECFETEEIEEETEEYAFRKEPLIIELDAGHGGTGGAENEQHGVLEREVNLQIALQLKDVLETYENVTVYLTREDDSSMELEDRVKKAIDDGADVLISLHNNAAGSICDYYNGCTVLVARGAGNPELSKITQELGCYILKELETLGIENQGLMFRITQDELYYDDGSLCDYYSIVRNSVKAGIPGIIVEHAFIDNEEDYQAFLADSDKISRLALADARGIAGYYHLKKKDGEEIPETLKDHKEKITLIISDRYQDNTYFENIYFTVERRHDACGYADGLY